MAFTEDLDAFFDATYGFAVSGTLDGATTIKVIFDAPGGDVADRVNATRPSCLARASDVTASNLGDTLVIGATTYTIRERVAEDPDGALVRLTLQAS